LQLSLPCDPTPFEKLLKRGEKGRYLRESETSAVTSAGFEPKGVGVWETLGRGAVLFKRPCMPPRPGAII